MKSKWQTIIRTDARDEKIESSVVVPPDPQSEVIDLVSAAKAIRKKYPKLFGLIHRIRDLQSAQTDLDQAQNVLELRSNFPVNENSPAYNILISQSIFVHALILYSRSTDTSTNHRRKILVVDNYLDVDERKTHRTIMKIRNDGIAHYGMGGEDLFDSFRRDDVFLFTDPENDVSKIASLSKLMIHSEDIFHSLDKLVNRSLIICNKLLSVAKDDLWRELLSQLSLDPSLRNVMSLHKLKVGDIYQGLSPLQFLYPDGDADIRGMKFAMGRAPWRAS